MDQVAFTTKDLGNVVRKAQNLTQAVDVWQQAVSGGFAKAAQ